MARVLLINPNKWGRGITSIWIASHTALLRSSGHDVQLFDATFYSQWSEGEVYFNTLNQQYRPTDYESMVMFNDQDIFQSLQKTVDKFQPKIIFWSAISSHIHGEGEYVNIQYGYQLVSNLKTSALLITGGLQPTAQPSQMFDRYPSVDAFVRGESEFVLNEVANSPNEKNLSDINGIVFKKGNEIVYNQRQALIHPLDQLPEYDYGIFDEQVFLRPYNGTVLKAVDYELSRGCLFTCSYCVETVIQKYYGIIEVSETSGAIRQPKRYLRVKSAKRIFNELKYLHDDFGITLIRCQDTNFLTIDRQVLKELGELLSSSNLDIMLYVETRLDRLNAGDVALLKSLKVDGVGTGVEVASEDFREGHLNRFASPAKLAENAKLLRENNIRVTAYNIIGLPEETEDMILDTIRLNQHLSPNNITVAFYSPYLGTVEAERGYTTNDFSSYEENVDGQLRTTSRSKLVSPELLQFYKKNFVRLVRDGLGDLENLKKMDLIQS